MSDWRGGGVTQFELCPPDGTRQGMSQNTSHHILSKFQFFEFLTPPPTPPPRAQKDGNDENITLESYFVCAR